MRRRFFGFGSVLLGLAAFFLLAALACFRFPQQVLTVDSGAVKADAIVVLGGSIERPEHAAELFHAGAAPKILLTGMSDAAANDEELKKLGVPAAAIAIEGRSNTTLENAEFSVPLLRRMGARRVIVVTSWYHSRRGLACFEHFAPDLAFFSSPSYFAFSRQTWKRSGIGGYVHAELFKLPGYWMRYGVRPFPL